MKPGRFLYYLNGKDNSYVELPEGTSRHKEVPCEYNFEAVGGKATIIASSQEKVLSLIWYQSLELLSTCLENFIREIELPIDFNIELTLIDHSGGYAARKALAGGFINDGLDAFDFHTYEKENRKKFGGAVKKDIFEIQMECMISGD